MSDATLQIADKVANTFDFSVDKFPLSGPDGMRTPFYGLFRSDTMGVVGASSVTSRYVVHTTDDVIALTEAAGEAFDGDINIDCHFNEGHYVNVVPSKEHRRTVYGSSDNVFPRVIIRAGYDGKSFQATMGYYRDLCLNLSMLKQISGTSVSIRHTKGLRDKMDALIRTFQTLRESWATLGDVITNLQEADVSMIGFLDSVYPVPDAEASESKVTRHRNRTREIFTRMRNERFRSGRGEVGKDFRVSAWEALNYVQGHVQHRATRKNGASDFDRMIKAFDDPAVVRAQNVALAALSA